MKNFSNSYQRFVLGLDEINYAARNHLSEFIQDIEDYYNEQLLKIAEYILGLRRSRVIVMISGPSASGKTTTALMLKEKLKQLGVGVALISLDDFYKERIENEDLSYESPQALNIGQFKDCMKSLLRDGFCEIPKFNFINRKCEPYKNSIELREDGVAIIEGIHGLNPVFTQSLPEESIVRIYISVKQGINNCDSRIISNREIRLIRRLVRDHDKRKSDPENTLMMWEEVCRGQAAFIYPFKRTSDITVNSLHLYELCAMRNVAIPLLGRIKKDSPVYEYALALTAQLERFTPISTEYVPKNSMLREFIGESIYEK